MHNCQNTKPMMLEVYSRRGKGQMDRDVTQKNCNAIDQQEISEKKF